VGAAAGVVFSVGHAGGLLGPQLGGYLRDLTGRHEAGLAVMLVMTVVMTAFALAIPETYGGVERAGRP
jgi:cyanate permease